MNPRYTYTPDPDDVAIKDAITSHGLSFKDYSLVNNYGWLVTTPRGYRIDIQHTLNVYGASVDYYSIHVWTPDGPSLDRQTASTPDDVKKYLDALLETLNA